MFSTDCLKAVSHFMYFGCWMSFLPYEWDRKSYSFRKGSTSRVNCWKIQVCMVFIKTLAQAFDCAFSLQGPKNPLISSVSIQIIYAVVFADAVIIYGLVYKVLDEFPAGYNVYTKFYLGSVSGRKVSLKKYKKENFILEKLAQSCLFPSLISFQICYLTVRWLDANRMERILYLLPFRLQGSITFGLIFFLESLALLNSSFALLFSIVIMVSYTITISRTLDSMKATLPDVGNEGDHRRTNIVDNLLLYKQVCILSSWGRDIFTMTFFKNFTVCIVIYHSLCTYLAITCYHEVPFFAIICGFYSLLVYPLLETVLFHKMGMILVNSGRLLNSWRNQLELEQRNRVNLPSISINVGVVFTKSKSVFLVLTVFKIVRYLLVAFHK